LSFLYYSLIYNFINKTTPSPRVDLAKNLVQRDGGGELFLVGGGVEEADDCLASDADRGILFRASIGMTERNCATVPCSMPLIRPITSPAMFVQGSTPNCHTCCAGQQLGFIFFVFFQ